MQIVGSDYKIRIAAAIDPPRQAESYDNSSSVK
jgi:hypothetical protein